MITRTARETVMLEALEGILLRQWVQADWNSSCSWRSGGRVCRGTTGTSSAMGTPRPVDHIDDCPFSVADSAIATVKAMDEAELAAGTAATATGIEDDDDRSIRSNDGPWGAL